MSDQHPMNQEPGLEESIVNAHIVEQSGKVEMGSMLFGVGIVLVLTLLTTVVVGSNWGRWGNYTQAMKEAGLVIEKIPRSFDDWEAASDDEKLDQASVEQLELSDYVVRRYTNKTTSETVSLIFMVGKSGRLTVHTPVICFGGRNFKMDSLPTPVSFPVEGTDEKDTFSKIVFRNQSVQGGAKLFYYGLSTGQEWVPITGSSRSDFQHYRFLYKMQIEAYSNESGTGENDVIARFLRGFLPKIHGLLTECR